MIAAALIARPARMAAQSRRAAPAQRQARTARAVVVARAAASAAPSGHQKASVPVTFTVNKKVHFGQQVVLVGSHERLGAWCLDTGAVRMAWTVGNDWSATLELPLGAELEYKFAVVDPELPPMWEQCSNRCLTVTDASASLLSGEWEEELELFQVASYNAEEAEEKLNQHLERVVAAAVSKQQQVAAPAPVLQREVKMTAAAEAVVGGLIEQAEQAHSAAAAVAQLVAEELVGAGKKQSVKRSAKPAAATPAATAPVADVPAVAETTQSLPEQLGFSGKRRAGSKASNKRGTAAKGKAADSTSASAADSASTSASTSASASEPIKYSPEQLEFMRRMGKL